LKRLAGAHDKCENRRSTGRLPPSTTSIGAIVSLTSDCDVPAAIGNARVTPTPVFGRNAQKAAIRDGFAERAKSPRS
jgi:hypothetical protein